MDPSSPLSDDNNMEASLEHHNQFCRYEDEIRLRSANLTANELRHLQEESVPLANKVNSEPQNFVLMDVWAQRLLDELPWAYSPGQVVMVQNHLFSILKLRLVAQRMSAVASDDPACFCLPQPALMPYGCRHRPGQAFKGCTECMQCHRCGMYCKRMQQARMHSCKCLPSGLDLPHLWRH